MQEISNIADALAKLAAEAPFQPGVVFPSGRDRAERALELQLNFYQLNELCDRYAHGLVELGIHRGERVLLLIKPGVALIAVVFALIKLGAVPVLIDPGMGRQAFLRCVEDVRPSALIGIPLAHFLRRLVPGTFRSVKRSVVVDGPRVLADATLDQLRSERSEPFAAVAVQPESEAAIAFTSGSTGTPKGVVFLHGLFHAQLAMLRSELGIQPGEVDLALLYIFALFNPALGVTTIIPDMDPTRSAEVNPAYIVEAIQTHGVTNAFGSPTIWKRVAPYCKAQGIRLPSLKRVIMAGAPVPPELIQAMYDDVLGPKGDVFTPFGATEAMPLTMITGREILRETSRLTSAGKGMCVGRPLRGVELRVIRTSDAPIPTWNDALIVPPGEVGEIVVKGEMVTRSYVNRPEQTAAAKIADTDGTIWHRMGDLGYIDAQGRLWFCGRKAHRVITEEGVLYPIPCETIFNQHPEVQRSALVGVGEPGRQRPVLVVEPKAGHFPRAVLDRQRLAMELLAMGAEYAHTQGIRDILFYRHVFPTDVRHNVKIQRELLAVWAAQHLGERIAEAKRPAVARSGDVSYHGRRTRRWLGVAVGIGAALSAVLLIGRSRRRYSGGGRR